MLKTLQIVAASSLMLFSLNGNAQLGGKLNKLKSKVGTKTKVKTPTVAITPYDKHMKAGAAAEADKDLKTAYKEYQAALAEKSGDYSASSAVKSVKGELSSYYSDEIKKAEAEGRCDDIVKWANESKETINSSTTDPEFYNKKAAKCKETIAKNQAKADAGAEQQALLAKVQGLAKGKGYFFTELSNPNLGVASANVGDDLMVFFNLEKTLDKYITQFSIGDDRAAYAMLTMSIDGKKIVSSDVIELGDDYFLKENKYFNFPLHVSKEGKSKLSPTVGMLTLPSNFPETYAVYALTLMKEGTHKVKFELGLSDGPRGKEMKGVIASSTISITSDAAGIAKISENAPRWIRPLASNEMGKFESNNPNFVVGEGDWFLKLSTPQPMKYYIDKWCTSIASCEVDHDDFSIVFSIDGQDIATYDYRFWKEEFSKDKNFQVLVLPKTDSDMKDDSGFPGLPTIDKDNDFVIPMLEMVYGEKLKEGKHKLNVKLYSYANKPFRYPYTEDPTFINNRPHIAEGNFDFTIKESSRSTMKNSAALIVPSKKKGGDWTRMENYIMKTVKTFDEEGGKGKIIRVASTTDWTINRNAFGVILNRTSKAQVIVTSRFGCRVSYYPVQEDYDGSKYGNPKMSNAWDMISASPGLINVSGIRPIPCNKVK